MKKIFIIISFIITSFLLSSCQNDKVTLITPSGTPSLALGSFLRDQKSNVNYEIVAGADPLVAAFTNSSHDIIVAPINLGVKLYNGLNNFSYILYRPLIGCNYVIFSTTQISKISDLQDQNICIFGANSTPDIVVRSLLEHYNINVGNIRYVDSVTTANSLLISGDETIIVSAEPSASKIRDLNKYFEISLSDAWKEAFGLDASIPQSGLFIKKDKIINLKSILSQMEDSIKLSENNLEKLANDACMVDESLDKIGIDTLIKAIPGCNIFTNFISREKIDFYLNKIIDLNLGQTIGNKLPNEEFYYQES